MENGEMEKWRCKLGQELVDDEEKDAAKTKIGITVREVLTFLMENLDPQDTRELLRLGHGDPSYFPSFRPPPLAKEAFIHAIRSDWFNCYTYAAGLPPARQAVAEYLSKDLPYKLLSENVFITTGCTQAIEVTLYSLARPKANVLLPTPGYQYYEAYRSSIGIEVCHFDLLPESGWEVNLDAIKALADTNTVAMVIINPGNPCGNVYSYHHLQKVAEVAKKLGIVVISDEVYAHITLGSKPFVPMGVFGSDVPVITVGSISKRWLVPGWRIGWLVINDTCAILQKLGVIKKIHAISNMSADANTALQGALPQILKETNDDFFSRTKELLRYAVDICYQTLKNIPCFTCPYKPEGSFFMMVQLNLVLLDDIHDDMDFCIKLAKEENILVLPGMTVGMKNWLRVTYALEPSALHEGLARIENFCQRHAAKAS